MKLLMVLFIFITFQDDFKYGWKKLYEDDNLRVEFLYYNEGNSNKDDGVVILLGNKRDYPIYYSFDLLFKSDSILKSEPVKGSLEPKQVITGSSDSLYWIPFEKEKLDISEVGITKINVKKVK